MIFFDYKNRFLKTKFILLCVGGRFPVYLKCNSRILITSFFSIASKYSFCTFSFSKSGKKSLWMIFPICYKITKLVTLNHTHTQNPQTLTSMYSSSSSTFCLLRRFGTPTGVLNTISFRMLSITATARRPGVSGVPGVSDIISTKLNDFFGKTLHECLCFVWRLRLRLESVSCQKCWNVKCSFRVGS